MSDDAVLGRLLARDPESGRRGISFDDGAAPDDQGAFGWLRGHQDRSVMLELRKSNGNILAVGYSWLEKAEFDPSIGITLHVGDQRIQISGRNLNAEVRPNVRLFEGITRHRVPWIQEAGELDQIGAANAITLVESITW